MMRVPLQKVKSCKEIQSEEQTARFISFIAILRAIELFSRTHVTDKAGDFFASKIWQNNLQALILFRSALKSSTTGLIRRQPKGTWLPWYVKRITGSLSLNFRFSFASSCGDEETVLFILVFDF